VEKELKPPYIFTNEGKGDIINSLRGSLGAIFPMKPAWKALFPRLHREHAERDLFSA
jgi:hypothetical protein